MKQVQMGVRLDPRVRRAVSTYCRTRGLKVSRFVEEALLDKLEEIEDQGDLEALRREPTRPFEEIVRELKASGRL
jgi:hypothetical protein